MMQIILLLLSLVCLVPQIIILIIRIIQKKEDYIRIGEKFGIASRAKLPNLVWLHAASVGESKIALTIISLIETRIKDLNFMITSGTVTSGQFIAAKISGKKNIIHQYVPIDNYFTVKQFINFWRPRLGIFIESEIWPNLIVEASKTTKLIIANARMSERSYKKWASFTWLTKFLANSFEKILAREHIDYNHYIDLGFKNVKLLGNLKFHQNEVDLDHVFLNELKLATIGKKVIFAASTHEGEEEMIINLFKKLRMQNARNDLVLIIAPRHPGRLGNIINNKELGYFNVKVRSKNEQIKDNTDIFILDTLGEMSNIFAIKPITFMGGSFKHGCHNFLEPAAFESPIIFGPDVSNFAELAEQFLAQKAAIQIKDEKELFDVLSKLLSNEGVIEIKKLTANAIHIIQNNNKIGAIYLSEFIDYTRSQIK
ncbi:MAG: 3-deoxy-D-manno-octulosonic acid transferase [Rickettsiaceae bacterium]|nr:3-deoxy-D-manno-octulosonic acid transferase [Rickettsiaceae bacterium]